MDRYHLHIAFLIELKLEKVQNPKWEIYAGLYVLFVMFRNILFPSNITLGILRVKLRFSNAVLKCRR